MPKYIEFGRNAEAVLRGGEALNYTSTATTVHVEGGKGGKPGPATPFCERHARHSVTRRSQNG
jgi:hypothetical protein